MYFSKTTLGFYAEDIHGTNIPDDAVEITIEQYNDLIDGQSNGKLIVANDEGYPELIEPEVPSYAFKRKFEYPPITDYLDAVVKGDQVQIQNYIDACLAVKAKYPKPE